MGKRNKRGFLTVELLKQGEVDQYAVFRGGRKHVVELGWRATPPPTLPFYVVYTITDIDTLEEQRYQTFATVDEARALYRTRVRNINH